MDDVAVAIPKIYRIDRSHIGSEREHVSGSASVTVVPVEVGVGGVHSYLHPVLDLIVYPDAGGVAFHVLALDQTLVVEVAE